MKVLMVGGVVPRLDTVSGLVEEDVSRLIGGRPLGVSLTKETLNRVWLNLLQGTHKAYMSLPGYKAPGS